METQDTEQITWVVIDAAAGLIRCERCGASHPFRGRGLLPLTISEAAQAYQWRSNQHRGCLAQEEATQ